jgi:Flp pilus assembly protein TadB
MTYPLKATEAERREFVDTLLAFRNDAARAARKARRIGRLLFVLACLFLAPVFFLYEFVPELGRAVLLVLFAIFITLSVLQKQSLRQVSLFTEVVDWDKVEAMAADDAS